LLRGIVILLAVSSLSVNIEPEYHENGIMIAYFNGIVFLAAQRWMEGGEVNMWSRVWDPRIQFAACGDDSRVFLYKPTGKISNCQEKKYYNNGCSGEGTQRACPMEAAWGMKAD
jgi:hypothetical protein